MSDQSETTSNTSEVETKPVGRSVTSLLQERHSTRGFLPNPVPSDVLEECLHLAQRAASNSNLQPWRTTIVTGAALSRLNKALVSAVEAGEPDTIAPIPEKFKLYRSAMGHALYGKTGYNVSRENKDAVQLVRIRNYRFFDAPMAMILSVDSCLDTVDVLSAGLYLKGLMLLLQERGISCCYSVSVAGYPAILKRELGIEEHMNILCGVAIGYEDPEHNVNRLRQERDHWKETVRFVTE